MRVVCRCEHCAKKLRATEEMLGKRVRCPQCSQVTRLHSPGTDSISAVQVEEPPQPRRVTASPAPLDPEFAEDLVAEEVPAEEGLEGPPRKKQMARMSSQVILRTFVVITGLLGAGASGIIARAFQQRFDKPEAEKVLESLRQAAPKSSIAKAELEKAEMQQQAWLPLYVAAGVGLVGAALGLFRLGLAGAILMLGAPVWAAIVTPFTLVFTGFFIVGGLMAIFVRSGRAARAAAEQRADRGLPPARTGILAIIGATLLGLVLAGYVAFISGILYSALMGK